MSRNACTTVSVLTMGLLVSCAPQASPDPEFRYKAEVRRTAFGIPHITAEDFGSLGYGEGYAAAEDHVCNIADAIVVARGERAKFHGVGENNKHLQSDIVVRALDIPARAKREFAAQSEDDRAWITGYADGYNRYIKESQSHNQITSWCNGAKWLREISPQDLFARFQLLAQTTPLMASMIATAAPPTDRVSTRPVAEPQQSLAEVADTIQSASHGSNGWAFGKDKTENGRGMLLANPHYPWTGTNRFWEKHLVIPGKLNVYGSHLIGIPGVGIGFNEAVGWTHTVSASQRVVFYSLKLVPGDPTSYFYDGEPRKMTAVVINVPVREKGGDQVAQQEHTVWFSHYGPMIAFPDVPWTDTMAVSVRDANYPNQNLFAQWRAMGLAADMDEFKDAFREWNAIPWVNTMAASSDGRAVYIDGSNVGRLSTEAIDRWRKGLAGNTLSGGFYRSRGMILLDGSDSRFEWQPHPEARIDGIVPFVEQPQQERTDYVFNANDSHWLTNVDVPLVGFSPLYGPERTARSLRTRMNATLLTDTDPAGPAGEDGRFSLQEMQRALLANQSLTAELLLPELLATCSTARNVSVGERVVDLASACSALRDYNGRLDLDSNGAVLFREWITRYESADYRRAGKLFSQPFDASDPVNTPRGLANEDVALQQLARAVLVMQRAGLDLDIALGDAQFIYRESERIALHGGGRAEGVANIIGQWNYDAMAKQIGGKPVEGSRWLTDKGYPITYGTSFLLSLSYTDNGPVAEAFLTYGESGDPTSEHYTDQTKLFSQKRWRPVLFSEQDIRKHVESTTILVEPQQSH